LVFSAYPSPIFVNDALHRPQKLARLDEKYLRLISVIYFCTLLDIFGFAFGKYQIALCSKRQSTDLKPEIQGKICRRRPNKSTLFENVQ
jgi:hypothetical protein